MLEEIYLTDFCSHEDTFIQFTPGVNAITGQSDAGKSNILYAIQWCMFDSLPGKFRKTSDLIRHRAKLAEVVIHFRVNGKLAIISRTATKSSGSWELTLEDGAYKGSKEVIPHLLSFLQLSPTTNLPILWNNAIAINQFGVKDGFEDTPTRRKEIFNKVLGVDDYNYVWRKLADAVALLKDYQQGKREKVIALEPIASQLNSLTAGIDEASNRKTEIDGILVSKENEFDRLKLDLATLEKAEKQINDVDRRLALDEGKLNRCADTILEIDANIAIARNAVIEAATLESEVEALVLARQKLSELEKALRLAYDQRGKYDQLDTRQKSIKREIVFLNEKLEQKSTYLQELEFIGDVENEIKTMVRRVEDNTKSHAADVATVNIEVAQCQKTFDALNGASGVCPTCGSELSETHRQLELDSIKRRLGELDSLRSELNDFDSDRNVAMKKMRQDLNALRDNQAKKKNIKAILHRFDGIENGVVKLEKELASIIAQLVYMERPDTAQGAKLVDLAQDEILSFGDAEVRCELARRKAGKLKDLLDQQEKLNQQIDNLRENINSASLELDDLRDGFNQELLISTRDSIVSLSNEIAALNSELVSLKTATLDLTARWKEAKGAQDNIDEITKAIEVEERKLTRLQAIRETIREAAIVIAGKLVPIISHEANKMFQRAWEGRKDASLEWMPDYAINITIDEQEIGYTSGGGMQVLAALAVRLAAMKTIGSIGLLIADEISMGAVDDELKEVIPSLILDASEHSQVLVIDHGGLFDNVISNEVKVRHENGKSIVG